MSRSNRIIKYPYILEYTVYDEDMNIIQVIKYPYRLLSYVTEDIERGEWLLDEKHRLTLYRLDD